MVNGQSKIKTYLSLFIPSGIGVVLYTFFAGLLLFLHQFKEIESYLDLPKHFQLLPIFMRWLEKVLLTSIGEAKTQALVVGIFWAFVGLGVYILLHGIARFISELGEGIDERRYYWPKGTNRNQPLLEATERMLFRVIALVALVTVVVGPLARVLSGPIWKDFIGPSEIWQLVVWFVAIWLMLHASVVLTRLVVLKARIFD